MISTQTGWLILNIAVLIAISYVITIITKEIADAKKVKYDNISYAATSEAIWEHAEQYREEMTREEWKQELHKFIVWLDGKKALNPQLIGLPFPLVTEYMDWLDE